MRALRHQTSTYGNDEYENGEKVYFKRKDFKVWKGPGVVMGKDSISKVWLKSLLYASIS